MVFKNPPRNNRINMIKKKSSQQMGGSTESLRHVRYFHLAKVGKKSHTRKRKKLQGHLSSAVSDEEKKHHEISRCKLAESLCNDGVAFHEEEKQLKKKEVS